MSCYTEKSLAAQMGHFGGPHSDIRDSVVSLSCCLVLSDLPPGMEPGRLHMVGAGVFVQLKLYSQFFFSGLIRHGGTSPLSADDQPIPDWAYRLVVIAYPPTSFVFGNVRHALSALPYSNEPFYLSQEMTGALHTTYKNGLWCSCANFAITAKLLWTPMPYSSSLHVVLYKAILPSFNSCLQYEHQHRF